MADCIFYRNILPIWKVYSFSLQTSIKYAVCPGAPKLFHTAVSGWSAEFIICCCRCWFYCTGSLEHQSPAGQWLMLSTYFWRRRPSWPADTLQRCASHTRGGCRHSTCKTRWQHEALTLSFCFRVSSPWVGTSAFNRQKSGLFWATENIHFNWWLTCKQIQSLHGGGHGLWSHQSIPKAAGRHKSLQDVLSLPRGSPPGKTCLKHLT